MAAAAALTAAADGKTITKNNAEAAEASEAASEAQEANPRNQQKRSKNASEKKRKTRQEKIQKILEELKGTRNILSTKSVKKRILIPKVKNKGETINSRQGIANVFAEFSESLYEGEVDDEEKRTESRTDEDERIPDQHDPSPEFTKNEIQDAIDRLKKGKAKDSSGVRAEQLKIAVTIRKKNQDDFQRNYTTRRLHTEELAQDSNPSNLQQS